MKLYIYDEKILQFKQISIKQYIWGLLIIGLIFSSMGFGIAIKTNYIFEKIPVIIRNEPEFSEKWLKNTLIKLNAQNIDVLLAQSKLETNNYQSNIFKLNRNIFGMKRSSSRISTHNGEQFGHAMYNNYYDSVLDILFWQNSYGRNLNQEQYLHLISEIYAEDKEYKNKILKLIK